MKFFWILVGLTLFSSIVFAQITVDELNNPAQPQTDAMQFQTLQKLTQLEAKINTLPTNDQINAKLAENNKVMTEKLDNAQFNLIVMTIVLSLMQIVLFLGVLFWLKGEGKF